MLMTQSNESLEVIIMSRPKGSKNKKTIIKNSNLGEQITQKETAKASLEEEKARLLSVIAEINAKLRAVNKDIRALDKQITALQKKRQSSMQPLSFLKSNMKYSQKSKSLLPRESLSTISLIC